MNRLATALVLMLFTLAAAPAQAMKDIAVDWETGEVTVTEEPVDEETEEDAALRYIEEAEEAEEKIERLQRAVEIQQQVIRKQRALIKGLREELRRKDRLLLGMEQLLRRSR
jgi:TolA-binding protein